MKVQLWSWAHSVTDAYKELVYQNQKLFSLNLLKVDDLFQVGFLSTKSTVRGRIDADRTKWLVYRDVKDTDNLVTLLMNTSLLFYYHKIENSSDVIVDFPNQNSDALMNVGAVGSYVPMSYVIYSNQPTETMRRKLDRTSLSRYLTIL